VDSNFLSAFGPLLFGNCKCFLHRRLAFRQGEELVCPSSYSERDLAPASIFEHWVCNYTLQGARDVEPAVQLHSKKDCHCCVQRIRE
jgi:hypothetical protein